MDKHENLEYDLDYRDYRYACYYEHLFPFQEICDWLSYGDARKLVCREFSFIAEGKYIRRQSYCTHTEMRSEIEEILPHKIDIGAIYNSCPASGNDIFPLEKEFVLDIDLTDYDNVRNCCKVASVCNLCWKYIIIAYKIIDTALREDFGFKHILWVFSGRRGIHCWICDEVVRTWSSTERSQVFRYLALLPENIKKHKTLVRLDTKYVHNHVRRAIKIIEPTFVSLCIEEHNLLGTNEGMAQFLNMLPNKKIISDAKEIFDKYNTSITRWNAFVEYCNKAISSNTPDWQGNEALLDEIKLTICYPRLDYAVTSNLSHLLKCPFSIHPDTDQVSLPLSAEEICMFDPSGVPKLFSLFETKNSQCKEYLAIDRNSVHYQKFCRGISVFKKFVSDLRESRQNEFP